MSNYADPEATRPVSLGPCRCPRATDAPPPHEADSANVLVRFGYGDLSAIRRAMRLGGREMFNQVAILRGVKSWTLVLPDGQPRPVDAEQIALLDEATVIAFMGDEERIGLLDDTFSEDPLPTASGGPSPAGSPESDSPTPPTPAPAPSTTS